MRLIANLSIKTKLISAVSLMMVLIVLAVSYLTVAYFESETKALIADEQFAKVSLFAGEIDDKLANVHDLLIVLAKKVPVDLFRDRKRAKDFLNEHVELHKIFDNGLYLFDTSAILVAEAPQVTVRVGKSFAYRHYLSLTLSSQQPYISDPYFSSQPDRHPSIMLTAPVFGPKGELAGVLSGSIDLVKDNILSRMMAMTVGKSGYFYVITRDRRIILHPERNRVLQQDVPVGANKLLEKAILGFEGTGENVNSRGLHAITSFRSLKQKDWLVAANFPVIEAYGPIYRAEAVLAGAAALIILIVPVIVWYLMNLLTNPLLSFTRHVQAMPEQKGDARLMPVSSYDEIGRLATAFNSMVVDIDMKQAEIKARQEEVEKLLGEIGEFNHEIETLMSERTMSLMALTVADRIRNPASLIAGICSRMTEKGEVSEKQKENFDIITDSSRKLEEIVSDFQSLLKTKQTMFKYEDLNKTVESVVSVIAGEADAKGVSLVWDFARQPLMINSQISLLRVAIFHLVKNAIEATPAGGRVAITTSGDGDKVALSISDSGPGIPAEIVARIFEPFFTTKERSFGLGLPLVKQVISEHMGEISVESSEGKGATFRIVFPVRWKQA